MGDEPEAEEVLDLLVFGARGNVLDLDGVCHDGRLGGWCEVGVVLFWESWLMKFGLGCWWGKMARGGRDGLLNKGGQCFSAVP